jgi:transposase
MGVAMRGDDGICGSLFSYIDLEKRVRADHPLRLIRQIANAALKSLSGAFAVLYSPIGRESIPPERLMRALLLQAFYSIRSERQLVGRLDHDLLFRWFVGLGIEDPVWDATTFTKNRDRLLEGEMAGQFLAAVLSQANSLPRHRPGSKPCCRAITSRSSLPRRRPGAPCWKPGRARRASAQKTARANRPSRDATACPREGRGGAGLSRRAANQ